MKVKQFSFRITRYWNFIIDRNPNFLLWPDAYPENTKEEDRGKYPADRFNFKIASYEGSILTPVPRDWMNAQGYKGPFSDKKRPFVSMSFGKRGFYIGWKVYGFVKEYFNWFPLGKEQEKFMVLSASLRLRHRRD